MGKEDNTQYGTHFKAKKRKTTINDEWQTTIEGWTDVAPLFKYSHAIGVRARVLLLLLLLLLVFVLGGGVDKSKVNAHQEI